MNRTPSSHNRIAVLIAEVSEAYQAEVWRGIAQEAGKHTKSLVCFLGSRVDSPIQQEAASNSIYRLAHSNNLDGLIIISSAVSTYLDSEQVQYLFDAHPSIPKISVGIPVSGAGSVCVDGQDAMIRMTEHMITVHAREHAAVIAGPQWHPESEERRRAIIETLAKHDRPLDPELLVHGSFERSSGRAAMAALLETGKRIDTVFCLNDLMAMGAVDELHARGIGVPDDISVTGFDGIEESEFCSPPLTTIRQPLFELGVAAVQELYRLFDGHPPRDIELGCRLVFRQSCPCHPLPVYSAAVPAFDSGDGPEGLEEVYRWLAAAAVRGDWGYFLDEFSRVLTAPLVRTGTIPVWGRLLAEIEDGTFAPLPDGRRNGDGIDPMAGTKHVSPVTADGVSAPGAGEDVTDPGRIRLKALSKARDLLWDADKRLHISERIHKKERNEILRSTGISLSEAFELPELLTRFFEGLRRIGFSQGFLVTYENGEPGEGFSRLIFHAREFGRGHWEDVLFPSDSILPQTISEPEAGSVWMLTPLVFHDAAIGHLLLPGNHPDPEVYETLTKQIASSIQGALLLEQVKNHEQSLEHEVRHRTEELTEVNRSLREEIETRIRLEKEVVDISRQTMERIGRDLHDDLCQHLAGVSMHVSALKKKIESENPGYAAVVDQINVLLGESIERAKAIVRGLLPPGLKEDGILVAVQLLCREVERTSGVAVHFEGAKGFRLPQIERAFELYRIIQEAVNNAVKHSGCRNIWVRMTSRKERGRTRLAALVRDDGIGFLEGNPSGMGLKIMRYRAERAAIALTVFPSDEGTSVSCEMDADEGSAIS